MVVYGRRAPTTGDSARHSLRPTKPTTRGTVTSHSGTGPVVSFENVSKHYGQLKAVDGLSLDLRAGETVALLGPNGAGKSTSLDMLLALRKPTAGKIEMFGNDPYHAVKSGSVGAMLQSGGLMPEVTVRELVTLVAGLHPRPVPVDITLRRAGIKDIAEQRGVAEIAVQHVGHRREGTAGDAGYEGGPEAAEPLKDVRDRKTAGIEVEDVDRPVVERDEDEDQRQAQRAVADRGVVRLELRRDPPAVGTGDDAARQSLAAR